MKTAGKDKHTKGAAKSLGIKEIAKILGISIGTVDRALHDRPGIRPDTRQRIMETAANLGYRPNLAARFLKSGKGAAIAVCLPRHIFHFFNEIRSGIHHAAMPYGSMWKLYDYSYSRFEEGETAIFQQALAQDVKGIIIAPGKVDTVKPLIAEAARRNVAVACVTSDAPGTQRLVYVSVDPFANGALAGEFLCCLNRPLRRLAVFTNSLELTTQAEKLRGFQESIRQGGFTNVVLDIVENHDSKKEAAHLADQLFGRREEIDAVYVSTANALPVLRAMERYGFLPGTPVIATDIFPGLVDYIRSRKVLATIYQHPEFVGRIAFEALYRFIQHGAVPPSQIMLPPLLVMRSTLDVLLARIRSGTNAARELPGISAM